MQNEGKAASEAMEGEDIEEEEELGLEKTDQPGKETWSLMEEPCGGETQVPEMAEGSLFEESSVPQETVKMSQCRQHVFILQGCL